MTNIFTVKPIISNKMALAMGLAFIELSKNLHDAEFMPRDEAQSTLSKVASSELEKLKDKNYLHSIVAQLKENKSFADVVKKMKATNVAPFMRDVISNINKDILTFTPIDIKNGDYILTLSFEYALAGMIVSRTEGLSEIQRTSELASIFNKFKSNPDDFKKNMNHLIESNQMNDLNRFSSETLDFILRQANKNKTLNEAVKYMLNNGFAQFER